MLFNLQVLKMNYEIILKNYNTAEETLDEILCFSHVKVCGSSEIIPYIIRAGFLVGRMEEINTKFTEWEVNLKELQLDNDYNMLFINYLLIKDTEISFSKLDKLIHSGNKKEVNSIAYYLKATASESTEDKEKYLKKAYEESNCNYSILKYAFENNICVDEGEKEKKEDRNKENIIADTKLKGEIGVELSVLGGGNSIGGSCYLLKFRGFNILIDAGVSFGEKDELVYPDFDKLKDFGIKDLNDIDVFLLTHAHMDHSGALVQFYKKSGMVPMYATPETCNLITSLFNSCSKRNDDFSSVNFELNTCLRAVRKLQFRKPEYLEKNNKTLKFEFFRAGHILGAAAIYLEVDGRGIFFTGDYCLENQKTVKGLDIPKNYSIELLISESTYGNCDALKKIPRYIQEKKLAQFIHGKIKEDKRVLVPAFALGRSQEIVRILADYCKEENIEPFRIYIDGLITDICDIYSKYTGISFKDRGILHANSNQGYSDKYEFIEKEVMTHSCCVIASSGMLNDESASSFYAESFLEDENSVCVLTGYQDEDSVGCRLKDLSNRREEQQYIQINHKIVKVRCDIEEYYLSAHCDMEDIIELTDTLKPKHICLIHGEVKKNEKSKLFDILWSKQNLNVCQTYDGEIYNF